MKVMVIVKATKASDAGELPSVELLSEMGQYNELPGIGRSELWIPLQSLTL